MRFCLEMHSFALIALVLALASALQTVSNALPVSISAIPANSTLAPECQGQFWAGKDIGTLMRMEAMPGCIFFDYDCKRVKDVVETLCNAGVNAVRLETSRG